MLEDLLERGGKGVERGNTFSEGILQAISDITGRQLPAPVASTQQVSSFHPVSTEAADALACSSAC